MTAVVACAVIGSVVTAPPAEARPSRAAAARRVGVGVGVGVGGSIEAAPTYTSVVTFVGAGVVNAGELPAPKPNQPLPAMMRSEAQFEASVQNASPSLASAVAGFYRNGGDLAQIVLTADEEPATLVAALGAFDALNEPGAFGDLYAVPALAVLDGPGYDQVAVALAAAAHRLTGVALLDAPPATVQAAAAAEDVAPYTVLADHLRTLLADRAGRAAIYTGGLATVAGETTPSGVAAGTPVPSAGVAAGLLAANDRTAGVWTAPSGVHVQTAGVAAATAFTNDQLGQLATAGVNGFTGAPGSQLSPWGASTLAVGGDAGSALENLRVLDNIVNSHRFAWGCCFSEPNAPALWGELIQGLTNFLRDIATADSNPKLPPGLWNGDAAEGIPVSTGTWSVIADTTTMSPADIAAGRVNVEVRVHFTDGTWGQVTLRATATPP